MSTKIIIENLPSEMTEEGLKNVFGQIGAVESVRINTDLLSRRSKGSGYVEMSLDVDAFRAINCFNGASFKDKKVSLKAAQPLLEHAKYILRNSLLPQVQNFGFSINKEKITRDH